MEPVISDSGLIGSIAFALSLFNIIVPVWLGMTVLMSAERRSWGVWLAGVSLLLTGVFFLFHSALLYGALDALLAYLSIPEFIGWIPITLLPLAWYCGMLWFSGYFEVRTGPLRSAHRFLLPPLLVLCLVLFILLFYNYIVNPVNYEYRVISSLDQFHGYQRYGDLYSGTGWGILFGCYLFYLLFCYGASLDALRRLEPIGRVSGDAARRRARPWLAGASLTQIGIALLVGIVLISVIQDGGKSLLLSHQLLALQGIDLGILLLVTCALLMLGEAVVRYEIFTGVIIPRQGFRKRWRGVLVMALGLGVAASAAVLMKVPGIYAVLGSLLILAVLYAFLTRRSSLERDRYLSDLRSFVVRKGGESVKNEGWSSGEEIEGGFHLLCKDVLNARRAWLYAVAKGNADLLPLLEWPEDEEPFPVIVPDASLRPDVPGVSFPCRYQGREMELLAVGLWSREGLRGVLLLERKEDDGLYTREELEIAQASCEGVLEMKARSEMEEHLARLQRQRLSENRVNEIRVRRLLHDEILPQLHTAMLSLGSGENDAKAEAMEMMGEAHRSISDLLRDLPVSTIEGIKRAGFTATFQRLLSTRFNDIFASVSLESDEKVDRLVPLLPPLAVETLFEGGREAIRNAARHARGDDQNERVDLSITIKNKGSGIELVIEDNGRGFAPGRGGAGGAGKGIELHRTMMEVVGGRLQIESVVPHGTRVRLWLPGENSDSRSVLL